MFLIVYYSVGAQDINDDFYPDIWDRLPYLYNSAKKVDLFSYSRYVLWSLVGACLAISLDIFIDLAFGGEEALLNSSGLPLDYNTIYSIKAATLSLIVNIIILLDMKSFTAFTMIVSILMGTVIPLVLVFVV
jgi:hypothetical protein